MANTVQLKKDGQIVYPVTDVSLIIGLQDAIKLPPIKTTTLPTASAETAGKMYYVGPDANDEYERYITSAVNGSYEWIDLGGTEIPLPSIADNLTTDDANTALSAKQGKVLNEEIEGLEAKVDGNEFAIFNEGRLSAKYIDNSYVDATDGSFVPYNNWSRTDYINVSAFSKIVVYSNIASGYNAFYDKNKVFISSFSISNGTITLSIPENACYIVVSTKTANIQSITFTIEEWRFVSHAALKKVIDETSGFDRGAAILELAKYGPVYFGNYFTRNGYYSSGGNFLEDNSYKCTDTYLHLYSGNRISFTKAATIVVFNTNLDFVGRETATVGTPYIAPSECYIQVYLNTSYASECEIAGGTVLSDISALTDDVEKVGESIVDSVSINGSDYIVTEIELVSGTTYAINVRNSNSNDIDLVFYVGGDYSNGVEVKDLNKDFYYTPASSLPIRIENKKTNAVEIEFSVSQKDTLSNKVAENSSEIVLLKKAVFNGDEGNIYPDYASLWQQGSLDGNGQIPESVSNKRVRTDYMAINPGITLKVEQNGLYGIYVYQYDESKTFITYGSEVKVASGTVDIGDTTKYIKLLLRLLSNGSITPDDAAATGIVMYDILDNKVLQNTSVSQWNVAKFNRGTFPTGMDDADVPVQLPILKDVVTRFCSDIFSVNEYPLYVDKSHLYDTYLTVFKQFYPYTYRTGDNGTAIFSKHPFGPVKLFTSRFVDNNNRGRSYPYAEFSINGNSVLVIFYHAWNWFDGGGGRDSECREGDAEDLVTLSANYERVIVVGDLNTYQYSEIEPFINAGFVAGNMGYWGNIRTFDSVVDYYIDNVLVRGMNLDSFEVDPHAYAGADHFPCKSKITFRG